MRCAPLPSSSPVSLPLEGSQNLGLLCSPPGCSLGVLFHFILFFILTSGNLLGASEAQNSGVKGPVVGTGHL